MAPMRASEPSMTRVSSVVLNKPRAISSRTVVDVMPNPPKTTIRVIVLENSGLKRSHTARARPAQWPAGHLNPPVMHRSVSTRPDVSPNPSAALDFHWAPSWCRNERAPGRAPTDGAMRDPPPPHTLY